MLVVDGSTDSVVQTEDVHQIDLRHESAFGIVAELGELHRLGRGNQTMAVKQNEDAFIGYVFLHEVAHRLAMLTETPEQSCIFCRSKRQIGEHAGQQA